MNPPGYDYASVNGTQVVPLRYPLLYHGAETPTPAEVEAAGGLPAKGKNVDLIAHAEPPPGAPDDSAFRGCTVHLLFPSGDAGAALWGSWVFEIRNFPGYDINTELQGRIPTVGGFRGPLMHAELEIAVPAEVPLRHLSQAGEVRGNSRGKRVKRILGWNSNP
jgi:hypothetical protein